LPPVEYLIVLAINTSAVAYMFTKEWSYFLNTVSQNCSFSTAKQNFSLHLTWESWLSGPQHREMDATKHIFLFCMNCWRTCTLTLKEST